MSKSRGFVVTNWNCKADVYDKLIAVGQVQFIAYGEEVCPKTQRKHHQVFMYFKNPKSTGNRNLSKIGKLFGAVHSNVDAMRGSFAQNEAYCSKEGTYKKVGVEPAQGFRGDLMEIKDMILKGETTADEVACNDPTMFHQYGRTIDRLEAIALRRQFRTKMTKCTWYTGPSGAGKSHKIFADYNPDTHFVKDLTVDWWDGYRGQPIVLLNEFRGEIKFSTMCALVDKWPMTVAWRGKESVPFLAKEIRVASIRSPAEVYHRTCEAGGEPWEQFTRRITSVNLKKRLLAHADFCANGTEVIIG